MADRQIRQAENTTAEHIPMEALERVLARAQEHSWKGLDASAHRFEEGSSDEIDTPALADIIAVAERMMELGEPFPESTAELHVVMNRAAEQVPHQ